LYLVRSCFLPFPLTLSASHIDPTLIDPVRPTTRTLMHPHELQFRFVVPRVELMVSGDRWRCSCCHALFSLRDQRGWCCNNRSEPCAFVVCSHCIQPYRSSLQLSIEHGLWLTHSNVPSVCSNCADESQIAYRCFTPGCTVRHNLCLMCMHRWSMVSGTDAVSYWRSLSSQMLSAVHRTHAVTRTVAALAYSLSGTALRCDLCERTYRGSAPIYHCAACPRGFDVCDDCLIGVLSRRHPQHRLFRTLAPYQNSNWLCDHCRQQLPSTSASFHCRDCGNYDLCRQCVVSSSTHPHALSQSIDSNRLYPRSAGAWACDSCRQRFGSTTRPFHCTVCPEFDLCRMCFMDLQL
jgi:hypothetical protein